MKTEPWRLALTAWETMFAASTVRPAPRALSVHVCDPERTVTGRFSGAISSRSILLRAADSLSPPTATPSIVTPLAIWSRREWSYSSIATTSSTSTPTTIAATMTRRLRPGGEEAAGGGAIVVALICSWVCSAAKTAVVEVYRVGAVGGSPCKRTPNVGGGGAGCD